MFRNKNNLRLQKEGFYRTPSNPPPYGPVCTNLFYNYMKYCAVVSLYTESLLITFWTTVIVSTTVMSEQLEGSYAVSIQNFRGTFLWLTDSYILQVIIWQVSRSYPASYILFSQLWKLEVPCGSYCRAPVNQWYRQIRCLGQLDWYSLTAGGLSSEMEVTSGITSYVQTHLPTKM